MSFLDDQLDDMMLQGALGLRDEDDDYEEENGLPEYFDQLGYDEI
jgi:hypothetical protein